MREGGMTLNGSWQKLCAGVFICCISLWFGVPAPSSVPGTPCRCESTRVHAHTRAGDRLLPQH